MTVLDLDYETFSATDLKLRGLDNYTSDPLSFTLLAAWSVDEGPIQQWDVNDGPFPMELRELLEDPTVDKWAFNAGFERTWTERILDIHTPVSSWRCIMALAYLMSFSGGLDDVGEQMVLPEEFRKQIGGKKLINMFCKPQKLTKNQPYLIRGKDTDPLLWQTFREYNVKDVIAEIEIKKRLLKYYIPDSEWQLYAFDQECNDRGMPIDMDFVRHAITMVERRKDELLTIMCKHSGLANPNSVKQLLPWLKDRGYPFDDVGKDTIKKVLTEHEVAYDKDLVNLGELLEDHERGFLSPDCIQMLKYRQASARQSVAKYKTLEKVCGDDSRLRYCLQFAGASRTGRFSGKRFNPANLTRTPKELEDKEKDLPEVLTKLSIATDTIRFGDYDKLCSLTEEPLNILAGTTRSSIRAEEGKILRVADYAAIESVVMAMLTNCERLLNVFANDKDPYIDFATELYQQPYEEIDKSQRTIAKPAVLGCGYRLGGGELIEGRKTGLWGYAENMGIKMSQEEAHRAVKIFREAYKEIKWSWTELEVCAYDAIAKQKPQTYNDLITFEYIKPFLAVTAPSGRKAYYYKPRCEIVTFKPKEPEGESYTKNLVSYMGISQKSREWKRLVAQGGKWLENLTQLTARDILKEGLLKAHEDGYNIVSHVYDEIVCEERLEDDYHSLNRLMQHMCSPLGWFPGLPLRAAGYECTFYRKD